MISAASSVSVYLHIFIWPKWILPNVFIKSLFSRFGDFRIFFFNKWLCDIKKKECLQDPNKVSESSSHSRALYYVSPCGRFSVLLFPQETWRAALLKKRHTSACMQPDPSHAHEWFSRSSETTGNSDPAGRQEVKSPSCQVLLVMNNKLLLIFDQCSDQPHSGMQRSTHAVLSISVVVF